LWTEDGVLLEPGGQAKIGKQLIGAEVEREIAEHPGMKILSYVPEIKELKVTDGWAYEWGYFSSSYKESPDAQAKDFQGKMVRILRKQSNGSWKFARVMWNLAE
jgi:ketosteroid isomerase-like protein